MFSYETRSWKKKKKKKKKHDTCKTKIQQDFVAREKQNKVITKKIPKTNVEQTKSNE
jgi:hypothetical protein